jgi:tetratricopeptide (TPR) repeat protein
MTSHRGLPETRRRPRFKAAAFVVSAVFAVAAGCASEATVRRPDASARAATTQDQARLLSMADEVAAMIPGEDFEVDRSVDRAAIVECCIALGDLDRAEALAARIENWRRGDALVRIGKARLASGDRAGAERCAGRALQDAAGWKDWGIERVSAAAASLWLALGDANRAKALLPAEAVDLRGAFEASRVATVPAAELPAMLDSFDRAIETQNLDVARGAIDGYLEVLARALASGDDALADRSRRAIDRAVPGLPHDLQVDTMLRVGDALRVAGRMDAARSEVAKAVDAFGRMEFEVQARPTVGVPIAEAQWRLGDRSEALARMDGLRDAFLARMQEVTDLRRAAPLRALAEGYMLAGERGRAESAYAAALAEGARNPNARPRANDLCTTMVSMARSGFVPPPPMDRTMASIRAGLAAPW